MAQYFHNWRDFSRTGHFTMVIWCFILTWTEWPSCSDCFFVSLPVQFWVRNVALGCWTGHAKHRYGVEEGILYLTISIIFGTGWCPAVISWFITPMNYSYIYHNIYHIEFSHGHISTERYRTGAPSWMISMIFVYLWNSFQNFHTLHLNIQHVHGKDRFHSVLCFEVLGFADQRKSTTQDGAPVR